MNYNINETDNQIEVKVSVPRDIKNKVVVDTAKIKQHLSENNISFHGCVQESLINNRHSKWSGTWVFSKNDRPVTTIEELEVFSDFLEKSFPSNLKKEVDKPNTSVVKSRSSSNKKTKTRRKRKSTRRVTNK